MSTFRYSRVAIGRCLKEEYGIRKYKIYYGGRHPYLMIDRCGTRIRIPIHALSNGESGNVRTTTLTLQNIRSALGPSAPPSTTEKTKRRLSDMTQEMEQAARRNGLLLERKAVQEESSVINIVGGKASLIRTKRGPILSIVVPEAAKRVFNGGPIIVRKTDASSWSIDLVSKSKLHISNTSKEIQITNKDLLPEDQTPFGRSPVTMVASKDCILVHLKDEDRVPVNEKYRRIRQGIRQSTKGKEVLSMEPVSFNQEALDTSLNRTIVQDKDQSPTTNEIRMTKAEMEQLARSVLDQVRHLERITSWRLARVTLPDGSKVWRAISDPIE